VACIVRFTVIFVQLDHCSAVEHAPLLFREDYEVMSMFSVGKVFFSNDAAYLILCDGPIRSAGEVIPRLAGDQCYLARFMQ
jgi:hypothetical protein